MTQWKDIETAPKDGTEVLLRAKTYFGKRTYLTDVYHGWWDGWTDTWTRWPHDFEPTHWMHIPPL